MRNAPDGAVCMCVCVGGRGGFEEAWHIGKCNWKYSQLWTKRDKGKVGAWALWNFFHLLNLPHEQSCEF